MNNYFTEYEAELKLGKRIRSLRDFSGVPLGTTGTVVDVYGHDNEFGVDIEWDLPHTFKPLRDGFSKDEYVDFLMELN